MAAISSKEFENWWINFWEILESNNFKRVSERERKRKGKNVSKIYSGQKAVDSSSRASVAEEKRFLVSCVPTNAPPEPRKLWGGIMKKERKKGMNSADVFSKNSATHESPTPATLNMYFCPNKRISKQQGGKYKDGARNIK